MRIVIDTNVLISAIINTDSVPAQAVDRAFSDHMLLSSDETRYEIERVLDKPNLRRFCTSQVLTWLKALIDETESIVISQTVTACRDPMDDKFLELAFNGKADIIISGDKDLLSMKAFKETRIITPADFLNIEQ